MEFDVRFGTLNEYRGNEEYAEIPAEAPGSCGSECGFVRLRDSRVITVIGECAFMGNQTLKGVAIPDQVEKIGRYAFFGCNCLLRISIPDSVLSIGDRAFCGCESLSEVELGHGVRSIGKEAFSDCINLRDIMIPENVTEIGERAFSHIPNLTIRGKKGTITERYAKENGIAFEVI